MSLLTAVLSLGLLRLVPPLGDLLHDLVDAVLAFFELEDAPVVAHALPTLAPGPTPPPPGSPPPALGTSASPFICIPIRNGM